MNIMYGYNRQRNAVHCEKKTESIYAEITILESKITVIER